MSRSNQQVFNFLRKALKDCSPRTEEMATKTLNYWVKNELTADQCEMLESVRDGLSGPLCDGYYVDCGYIVAPENRFKNPSKG